MDPAIHHFRRIKPTRGQSSTINSSYKGSSSICWGQPRDPPGNGDMGDFKDSIRPSSMQKINPNRDLYYFHLNSKSLMVKSTFGSVHSRSNGPINSDLNENWWTCVLQRVVYLINLDGLRVGSTSVSLRNSPIN